MWISRLGYGVVAFFLVAVIFVGKVVADGAYSIQQAYYDACVAFNEKLNSEGALYDFSLRYYWNWEISSWSFVVQKYDNGVNMAQTGGFLSADYYGGGISLAGGTSINAGVSLGAFVNYDTWYYQGSGGENQFKILGYTAADVIPVFNIANYAHAWDNAYFPTVKFPIASPVCNTLDYCGLFVDLTSGVFTVHRVGSGDCYADLCGDAIYPFPTPTPTQSMPTPTPPVSTPTPPSPTPTPTPPVSTPTPPQATPTPLSTPTSPPYPGYVPAPPVVYGTPVYSSTVVPTPDNDGTVIDSNIDDIEYNSQVPDVGQDLEEDDTWLDTIFDLFSNHPLVDVIKGSKLTTSGELCSLSVNLYGSVIEISFCNLVDYVEIFGYFVTVCASIYAYFIIFKAS